MDKRIYRWMLVAGGIVSALMLINLFNIPEWLSIVFSFLSMIGGGVFCSALVSLLIESENKLRDKKQKEALREYLLDSVKRNFIRLCERELSQLTSYYSGYILKKQENLTRKDFTLENVTVNICTILDKIGKEEEIQKNRTISIETIRLENTKKSYFSTFNIMYYDSLFQSLESLSADYSLFLVSEILRDCDIDNITALKNDIHTIIAFSSDNNSDNEIILMTKKVFFEGANEVMKLLNIPESTVVSCQYKPIDTD